MLGVSLVTADDWILRFFASHGAGDITRLNYAKRLFAVPIAVLGQATGQASLPFFARLFGEGKRAGVRPTGQRLGLQAGGRLAADKCMDDGRRPCRSSTSPTAAAASTSTTRKKRRSTSSGSHFRLALWSAQALYARAFYAAGNTLTPMVASTLITIASIPIYNLLYHQHGVVGLAIASDVGILLNTLAMVILLDRARLVRVAELKWGRDEQGLCNRRRSGVLPHGMPRASSRSRPRARTTFLRSLSRPPCGPWLRVSGLKLTKSELPSTLRRKKPVVDAPTEIAEETSGGVEP